MPQTDVADWSHKTADTDTASPFCITAERNPYSAALQSLNLREQHDGGSVLGIIFNDQNTHILHDQSDALTKMEIAALAVVSDSVWGASGAPLAGSKLCAVAITLPQVHSQLALLQLSTGKRE